MSLAHRHEQVMIPEVSGSLTQSPAPAIYPIGIAKRRPSYQAVRGSAMQSVLEARQVLDNGDPPLALQDRKP